MKTVLKIQELERQIRKLSASVNNSRENAMYDKIKENRKAVRDNLNNIEHNAGVLAKQFDQIRQRYEQLSAKSEITSKLKPDMAGIGNIATIVEDANYLTSELAKLEQKMRELNKNVNELVVAHNRSYAELKTMTSQQNALKNEIQSKEANILPQKAEIETQIKALEPKADKAIYEKYKSMCKDNIFPVFVPLRNNCCGGCSMEQSLHFVEKLKKNGMLACENCGRIILADD